MLLKDSTELIPSLTNRYSSLLIAIPNLNRIHPEVMSSGLIACCQSSWRALTATKRNINIFPFNIFSLATYVKRSSTGLTIVFVWHGLCLLNRKLLMKRKTIANRVDDRFTLDNDYACGNRKIIDNLHENDRQPG